MPIPIELLHPRWRIDGLPSTTSSTSWIIPSSTAPIPIQLDQVIDPAPTAPEPTQHDLYYSNSRDLLLKSLHDLELLQA